MPNQQKPLSVDIFEAVKGLQREQLSAMIVQRLVRQWRKLRERAVLRIEQRDPFNSAVTAAKARRRKEQLLAEYRDAKFQEQHKLGRAAVLIQSRLRGTLARKYAEGTARLLKRQGSTHSAMPGKLLRRRSSTRSAMLQSAFGFNQGEAALSAQEEEQATRALSLHNKFASSGVNFMFGFRSLDDFFGGLEKLIGTPSPDLQHAMEREHASEELFDSHNVFSTSPRREWLYVTTMEVGELPDRASDRSNQRIGWRLHNFVNCEPSRASKLRLEEVVGLRLYTGPMYVHYNNKVLRAGVRGKYVTTIHAINSSIVKLGRLQKAGVVYRGVTGGVLPKAFLTPNEQGVMGAVEAAFMSTTLDRDVALRFAQSADRSKSSMLFHIQMGMIDKGADCSWLSQFPAEAEILFAPLTGLEVISQPWMEGSTIVIALRLTCNHADLTIDQVVGKMKRSHLDLLDLMTNDLRYSGAPERALLPLTTLRSELLSVESGLFNLARYYSQQTELALEAQRSVMAALTSRSAWLEDEEEERMLDEGQLHPSVREETASSMRKVVALQARAGAFDSAIELLRLSLEFSPLKPEEQARVEHAIAAAGAKPDVEAKAVLHMAALLLSQGTMPPYPTMMVLLLSPLSADCLKAFGALVHRVNEYKQNFARSSSVLAFNKQLALWQRATVLGGTAKIGFSLKIGGEDVSDVEAKYVMHAADGGVGAVLCKAAAAGSLELVDVLLRNSVSVFESDLQANTALHHAVINCHPAVCRRLLEAGALADVPNWLGQGAWDLALQVTNSAVRREFSPSASDRDVQASVLDPSKREAESKPALSPIFLALLHPEVDSAHALLIESLRESELEAARNSRTSTAKEGGKKEGGAPKPSSSGEGGESSVNLPLMGSLLTPLMLAARLGNATAVYVLIQRGADVNRRSKRSCTALSVAAEEGHANVVQMLLKANADATLRDYYGYSATALACENGHEEAARLLLEVTGAPGEKRNNGWTMLMTAAYNGCEAVVRLLLEKNANVDEAKDNGFTALIAASYNGFAEVAIILLEAGALPDLPLRNGWTPLMVASAQGHLGTSRVLLKAKASVDFARPSNGLTALIAAACTPHDSSIVGELLTADADVDQVDVGGKSALMYASQHGNTSAIDILVSGGADPNLRRAADGASALIDAAAGGHTAVASSLIYAGADPNCADLNGASALMHAAARGHEQTMLPLLQAGAMVGLQDRSGRTALSYAVSAEAVRRLLEAGANPAHTPARFESLIEVHTAIQTMGADRRFRGAKQQVQADTRGKELKAKNQLRGAARMAVAGDGLATNWKKMVSLGHLVQNAEKDEGGDKARSGEDAQDEARIPLLDEPMLSSTTAVASLAELDFLHIRRRAEEDPLRMLAARSGTAVSDDTMGMAVSAAERLEQFRKRESQRTSFKESEKSSKTSGQTSRRTSNQSPLRTSRNPSPELK